MTFNELQQNYWQKDTAGSKLTIDSDVLIREVKRNREAFESSIFWRDFREVAVSIILAVFFIHGAMKTNNTWIAGSLIFLVISILFVAGFFIVDRHIQKKKRPNHGESLNACIESSLTQINHQIWLLSNIFWWYLLPPAIGMGLFFSMTALELCRHLPLMNVLPMFCLIIVIVVLVLWAVYWLNQYGIRKALIPRKQELETMLKSLINGKTN